MIDSWAVSPKRNVRQNVAGVSCRAARGISQVGYQMRNVRHKMSWLKNARKPAVTKFNLLRHSASSSQP